MSLIIGQQHHVVGTYWGSTAVASQGEPNISLWVLGPCECQVVCRNTGGECEEERAKQRPRRGEEHGGGKRCEAETGLTGGLYFISSGKCVLGGTSVHSNTGYRGRAQRPVCDPLDLLPLKQGGSNSQCDDDVFCSVCLGGRARESMGSDGKRRHWSPAPHTLALASQQYTLLLTTTSHTPRLPQDLFLRIQRP